MDGVPRLGDVGGPGSDLRFKVTQDVVAGEGACVAERGRRLSLSASRGRGAGLALLAGPDPGGGLDEQPLGWARDAAVPWLVTAGKLGGLAVSALERLESVSPGKRT